MRSNMTAFGKGSLSGLVVTKTLRVLCIALLLTYPSATARKKPTKEELTAKSRALVGQPAPDFILSDLAQQTFHLADHRGGVVLLAFWATWCPPCRSEMPMLARLQGQLASVGADIIPIAFDDPVKARAFLESHKLEIRSLVDQAGKVADLYGAHALPKAFVINRQGIVTKFLFKKQTETELRYGIEEALRDQGNGEAAHESFAAPTIRSWRLPVRNSQERNLLRVDRTAQPATASLFALECDGS